ncbi:MAG: hypothetical protein LBJ00_17055 [Planctomycetaceae bacterium]|jgi:hypothetical protein|nr:hypothetical protein [Planctomycetaceae bacterium]
MNTLSIILGVPFGILFGANWAGLLATAIVVIFYLIINAAERYAAAQKLDKLNKQKEQNMEQFENPEPAADQEIVFTSKPSDQKKKRNPKRSQPKISNDYNTNSTNNQKEPRRALVRELPKQGHGARFEAAPGTLSSVQLTPQVEATVKPELDSLTGIYDQTADDNNTSQNTINLINLLSTPEGIREAIILSEILNRPS